jgi:hypothetical protein
MWLLYISDSLHCNDMFAIHTHERRQTRINAGVVDLLGGRVPLANDNGARATAAFRAAKLGAGEPDAAEVLEEGNLGVDIVKVNAGSVEEKA